MRRSGKQKETAAPPNQFLLTLGGFITLGISAIEWLRFMRCNHPAIVQPMPGVDVVQRVGQSCSPSRNCECGNQAPP